MSEKTEKLVRQLDDAFVMLQGFSKFKHYKGGYYRVTGVQYSATHNEPEYVYKRIGGPDFDEQLEADIKFSRTFTDWFSLTDQGGIRFMPCIE